MQDLKINAIQTLPFWGERERNLSRLDTLLEGSPVVDLLILPEMFNTGFIVEPATVAEHMDGPTLRWMASRASAMDCVVAGSLIIKERGRYYNRLVWMQPDGNYEFYDKRHLFRMAGEDERFTMGRERLIVEVKGWKVCPLVCYDLRFPVWSKNTLREGKHAYDLLIYAANWPEARRHAWRTLLVARAIENQAYVIGINRVGEDGHGINHTGDSAVIDPRGNTLVSFPPGEEKVENFSLGREELTEYREQFRVGLDWDDYRIFD